jgi:hypothetical protein
MFWGSIALSLLAGGIGMWLSVVVAIPTAHGEAVEFGPAGTIVVLSVLFFFASLPLKGLNRRPRPIAEPRGGLPA